MIKMSNAVLQFATGNMDLFEKFADYWKHYQAVEEKKNVEYDKSISFAEKEDKLNAALKKAIITRSGVNYASESNIGEWFNHPMVRYETFAIVGAMVDMVLPQAIIDSIGLYTDVRQIAFGDSASFDVEPRDLFVVSKSGKAQKHTEIRKQFKGQVTILPEFRQLEVGVSMYGVLSGKESLAMLVAKVAKSIEVRMTLDAYTLFASTMAALSNTATTGLRIAGYSQDNLVRLAQQVTAWNQGSKAVVVGTQRALVNVLPDDANYRYELESDYVKIGYLRTAFGYDVMALPQVADFATPWGLALSDSYLWIISPASQKLLKLVIEGNTLSFTDGPFDNANLSQNSNIKKSWGLGVATNATFGVITL